MMTTTLLWLVAFWLTFGIPHDSTENWHEGDVRWIICPAEREAFVRLSNDAERDEFIEMFWYRRDTDPRTPENEFMIEHLRRIRFADQNFGVPAKRGSLTDRGRLLIMHGHPEEIRVFGPTEQQPFEIQVWRFKHIDYMGDNLQVRLIDRENNGEHRVEDSEEQRKVFTPWQCFNLEDMGFPR